MVTGPDSWTRGDRRAGGGAQSRRASFGTRPQGHGGVTAEGLCALVLVGTEHFIIIIVFICTEYGFSLVLKRDEKKTKTNKIRII